MKERFNIITPQAGKGGFGKVDKAEDVELERYVAIKTLDPLFKEIDDDDIDRFRKEAKTLARLSHPNIPAIYDVRFSPSDNDFKIIYEWIEGSTLTKYLQDFGVVSLEKAKIWFGNICSALQHAHESDIIHRDIKPSNVVITNGEEACYVVDFGIALLIKDIKKIKGDSKFGSPGYMSPEQEKGEDIDASSDIFSLGILLYESLSGGRPTIGHYKPLNAINEAIPPGVDELIKDSIAEKSRRIKSASEFIQRFVNATRPHSNLTNILSKGALHEMIAALSEMDESSFSEIPAGQRILILTRVKTLINHDDYKLRNPAASFLTQLVRVGSKISEAEYKFVADSAFKYGFDLNYSETWVGNPDIRTELGKVALTSSPGIHRVLTNSLMSFYSKEKLTDKEGWYWHDLRIIVQNLLTNTACSNEVGEKLAVILEDVIEVTLQK
jgi:serine/threonine-protein kinase